MQSERCSVDISNAYPESEQASEATEMENNGIIYDSRSASEAERTVSAIIRSFGNRNETVNENVAEHGGGSPNNFNSRNCRRRS